MSKYEPKTNTTAVVTSAVLMIVALVIALVGGFFAMQVAGGGLRLGLMTLVGVSAFLLIALACVVSENTRRY